MPRRSAVSPHFTNEGQQGFCRKLFTDSSRMITDAHRSITGDGVAVPAAGRSVGGCIVYSLNRQCMYTRPLTSRLLQLFMACPWHKTTGSPASPVSYRTSRQSSPDSIGVDRPEEIHASATPEICHTMSNPVAYAETPLTLVSTTADIHLLCVTVTVDEGYRARAGWRVMYRSPYQAMIFLQFPSIPEIIDFISNGQASVFTDLLAAVV